MSHIPHACHTHARTICAAMRGTATQFNTLRKLQHTATHCNTYACHTHAWPICSRMRVHLWHGWSEKGTATQCTTLQHTATHTCSTLEDVLLPSIIRIGYCNILQHIATKCNTLHRSATRCNTLQHTATHNNTLMIRIGYCNTLHYTASHTCSTLADALLTSIIRTGYCNKLPHTATHCNTLQHTATHCNTLSPTAIHCNTLQYTEPQCTIRLFNTRRRTLGIDC